MGNSHGDAIPNENFIPTQATFIAYLQSDCAKNTTEGLHFSGLFSHLLMRN